MHFHIHLNIFLTIQYVPHPGSLSVRPKVRCPVFPREVFRAIPWFSVHRKALIHPYQVRYLQDLKHDRLLLLWNQSYRSHEQIKVPELHRFLPLVLPSLHQWLHPFFHTLHSFPVPSQKGTGMRLPARRG